LYLYYLLLPEDEEEDEGADDLEPPELGAL
jgi:hypothetical protein